MDARIGQDERIRRLVLAALDGQLTDAQAGELAALDDGLLKLVLLAAAQRIAELKARVEGPLRIDPGTPSGQRPIYTKPAAPGLRLTTGPGFHRAAGTFRPPARLTC